MLSTSCRVAACASTGTATVIARRRSRRSNLQRRQSACWRTWGLLRRRLVPCTNRRLAMT